MSSFMQKVISSIILLVKRYPLVSSVLISALFFLPALDGVHLFDWDEINFAEASREMLLTGDWLQVQIDFIPFWEKPPLFFWLQASAMSLFGIGEYAARLPNAIAGILSLLILIKIGQKWHSLLFGFLWAGAYFGSVLPFLYFKSGIIDPWFNLFIFLGLYQFLCFHWKRNNMDTERLLKQTPLYYLFWSGFFIGIAILTKGPVAFLLVFLTMFVYWINQRLRMYISIAQFLFFCFSIGLVGLFWFSLQVFENGPEFFVEFIEYQYRLLSTADAGHGGFLGYHFVVLLVGCFPASVFAIKSIFHKPKSGFPAIQLDLNRWMKILLWVVLIVFSIVQSKIVHYSSLCYFPLTYFAAWTINEYIKEPKISSKWIKFGLILIGSLYIIATFIVPWLGQHPEILALLLQKDPFALANIQADVHWSGWEVIPAIILLLSLFIGIRFIKAERFKRAAFSLFVGTAIFVNLTLFFDINNIEAYSQRAAIDFFKSKQGQAVYVTTYGYKSYAHLYYTQKDKPKHELASNREWLLNGAIDKDVYIVSKINKVAPLLQREDIKKVGEKNGFVFLLRKKK